MDMGHKCVPDNLGLHLMSDPQRLVSCESRSSRAVSMPRHVQGEAGAQYTQARSQQSCLLRSFGMGRG